METKGYTMLPLKYPVFTTNARKKQKVDHLCAYRLHGVGGGFLQSLDQKMSGLPRGEGIYDIGHVRGEIRVKMHLLVEGRVNKPYCSGMKCLA